MPISAQGFTVLVTTDKRLGQTNDCSHTSRPVV